MQYIIYKYLIQYSTKFGGISVVPDEMQNWSCLGLDYTKSKIEIIEIFNNFYHDF